MDRTKLNQSASWAFEENKGQVTGVDSSKVTYFHKSGKTTMFLLKSGISYQFEKTTYPEAYKSLDKFANPKEREENDKLLKQTKRETYRMDIELVGANPNAEITTEGKSPDYIQYYNHNALDVHAYQKITYHNIYPNIDWVIYTTTEPKTTNNEQRVTSNEQRPSNYEPRSTNNNPKSTSNQQRATTLKYDFIVHPGGNPADIQLKTNWVEDLQIKQDGSLSLKNRMGEIKEQAPVSFQEGKKIGTKFLLDKESVRFEILAFDKSKDLVIDPSIVWATYYGGSNGDEGYSCSHDDSGNVYLAGSTNSNTNIASGGHQNSYGGGNLDAFLVKFNNVGVRQWATYYGGNEEDRAYSCVSSANGIIYIAGYTASTSSVASSGYQNSYGGGSSDGFIVKFNGSGVRQWATYYGGSWTDTYYSCVLDSASNLYLAGLTASSSGIASGGHQNSYGGNYDGFLTKFDSSGSRIWATYYGGENLDVGYSCSIDVKCNIFLTGYTESSNNIASGGHKTTYSGYDAFLVKFDKFGVRKWATYYGGSSFEAGYSSTIDNRGNVYIAGKTQSSNSISSGGHQNTYGGNFDAYLVKFDSLGNRKWATYYGGSQGDYGLSCIADGIGNIYFAGATLSNNGISYSGFNNSLAGGQDAFIVKFDSLGTRKWASYYGGNDNESINFLSYRELGKLYLAGQTVSTSGIAAGGHQTSYGGGTSDAFLIKMIDTFPIVSISIVKNAQDSICYGSTVEFSSNIIDGGTSPKYRWYKNGTLIDTNATYSAANLVDGDTVICLLKSNAPEAAPDSAWSNVLKFKVKPISTKVIDTSFCQGLSYFFKGKNRTTTGTYRDTLTNSVGCDSFVTLNLTVKDTSSYSYSVTTSCFSPSYFFNGFIRTSSGIYKDTLVNSLGCDSFVYLDLTVNKPTSGIVNVFRCKGDSVLIHGVYEKTTGTYYDTIANSMGCDSVLTMNLQFGFPDSGYQTLTICANKPIFFNGKFISLAGLYRDTLSNQFGCDSFVFLTLNTKPISTKTLYDTICQGQSVSIGSFSHGSTGTFVDTLTNSAGCDSIVTLHLMVYPTPFDTTHVTVCNGASVVFNGVVISTPGYYRDTFKTVKGCDSFVVLHLSNYTNSSSTVYHTVCSNKTFYHNGVKRDSSGLYYDTLKNQGGCDSFRILNLTVIPTSIGARYDTICYNHSIYFNGKNIDSPGIYRDTILNRKGCDSFLTLNLSKRASKSVNITNSNGTLISTAGFQYYQWYRNSAILRNENLQSIQPFLSGQYSVSVLDSFNCDYSSSAISYAAASIVASESEHLLLYPNPTSSTLYLESSYLKDKDISIVIRDLESRKIAFQYLRLSSSLISISTTHLSAGLYLIELKSKEMNVQKKFIIE